MEEAIAYYQQALRINPDYAEVHYNLGIVLAQVGRVPEAIAQYEQALRIKPDYAKAYNGLGLALKRMGRVSEAAGQYEQALRINPDYPEALNDLAWILATRPLTESGNTVRAVELAERACKLSGNRVANYLDTLAAAYAAAGRFDDAIGTAQKATELARSGGQPGLAEKIEGRLRLYRDGHAYYQVTNTTAPSPEQ
jgi:tetratricopeptide (TPR) repeat protein